MFLKLLLAITLICVYTQTAAGRVLDRSPYAGDCDEFRRHFPVVRFKATQRSGMGDVAAAYYNALALFENCRPKAIEIEFLDKDALAKFEFLGRAKPEFLAFIKVRRDMVTRTPLIIEVAADSGDFMESPVAELNDRQIFIKAPVFSNSEGFSGGSEVYAFGRTLQIGVPGLREGQYGVYPDSVAARLRDMSLEEVRIFVAESALRERGLDLISDLVSSGARVGLAYGLSSNDVSGYFSGYLKSLLSLERKGPLVIFTPSKISSYARSPGYMNANWIRGKVEILHIKNLPGYWRPTENKIYLIETPLLPNDLFTGLMKLSSANDIVPLGAGDGFISSAVTLGIPFAVTQVSHSRKVIADFRSAFMIWASDHVPSAWKRLELLRVISRIFHYEYFFSGAGLEEAQTLNAYRTEFKAFSENIGDTLGHWIKLANYLKSHEVQIRDGSLKLDFKRWPHDPRLQHSMERLAGQRGWLETKIHQACERLLR